MGFFFVRACARDRARPCVCLRLCFAFFVLAATSVFWNLLLPLFFLQRPLVTVCLPHAFMSAWLRLIAVRSFQTTFGRTKTVEQKLGTWPQTRKGEQIWTVEEEMFFNMGWTE